MDIHDRIFLAAKRISRRLGLPVRDLGWKKPLFTGSIINEAHLHKDRKISDLFHEVAHFALAHPSERCKSSFGWIHPPSGPSTPEHGELGPYGNRRDRKDRATFFKNAGEEEAAASCLGILAQRAIDDPDWKETLPDHSWEWGDFWMSARSLRKVGVCNKDFVPLFLFGRLPNPLHDNTIQFKFWKTEKPNYDR